MAVALSIDQVACQECMLNITQLFHYSVLNWTARLIFTAATKRHRERILI